METYPIQIALTPYSIIGLTLLILAASIAIYLFRLPSKSRATWSLVGFFSMVAISGVMTILSNSILFYNSLFAPWQDFWILAGGIGLVQLAYSIPFHEPSREEKVAVGIASGLAVIALVYCLTFNFIYLFRWTPALDVHDSFYMLLPLGTLFIIVLFFRRSFILSELEGSSTNNIKKRSILQHLLHPSGNDAKAFRDLALALSLAFLPGFQTWLGFPYPLGFILSNIGSILAIIAITLVYLNYAPEIKSFMAKLVGIALATVVFILAIFGTIEIFYEQAAYQDHQNLVITSTHKALLETHDLSVYSPEISYIVSWSALDPRDPTSYRLLYLSDQESEFDFDALKNENLAGYLETQSRSYTGSLARQTNDEWQVIDRYQTYPVGSNHPNYFGYVFDSGDSSYEIGISRSSVDKNFSAKNAQYLILILSSSVFVLLIFPLFLRQTLVLPIHNLLGGIKRVEQGELDTVIATSSSDEIGLLTHSFNRMVDSLKKATFEIQNRALYLEAEVSERTIELLQTNVQLENENKYRQIAESRLNQQLSYQKALAGCSQALLAPAQEKPDQQGVLNQALEYLRVGVETSRAYIFHKFEDEELGACFGMQAEVCAPGIPAHINNPTNQKFPLAQLPTDMVEDLLGGKPFGGPVEKVFSSTPMLREAFLNQEPPLLSVITFPIFDKDQMWGFVGYDECLSKREWYDAEVSILRTASEMIGNTLKRWEIETRLKETLQDLERRVQERTAALSQSNILLNEEIHHRQMAQKDLENRLQIEVILAKISARLLQPTGIRENISVSLEKLGQILKAERIFMVEFDLRDSPTLREFYAWEIPGISELTAEIVNEFMVSLIGLRERLREGETIFIQDIEHIQTYSDLDLQLFRDQDVQSLILSPLTIDNRVHGILGCSNLQTSSGSIQDNIRILELVAGMLKSLLQREYLIETLEQQVMERTHQLTSFLDVAMLSDQAQDLVDILQPALLSITQIVACDASSIHIVDERKSKLDLVAQRGIPMEYLEPLHQIDMDDEFLIWMQNADPYSGFSFSGDEPNFPQPFCSPGFNTFIGTRLRTGEKTLGILSCYRTGEQPFSTFQATILTALGELIGIIVENHRLRTEAEELATIEERQRLAREIHDAISQSVYSLSLFARSAKDAHNEENQAKLLSNLDDIEFTALQAMKEMRLLLYQLRELGQEREIEPALKARFKQVENRLGIKTTLEVDQDLEMTSQIQYEIWRILIEALNNIVKHAQASQVDVKLLCTGETIKLSVQDDGIGFNPEAPSAGMGLKNMITRAQTIAAKLEIVSEPGRGTEIMLNIPVNYMEMEGSNGGI